VTAYTYDTYGDVASSSVTTGSQIDTTTYKYDTLGRKYCEVSPNGTAASVNCPSLESTRTADTTSWTFDSDGDVSTVTDPDGNVTTYTDDGDGNVTQSEDPLGNYTQTHYDADDRMTSVISGFGTSYQTTTSYAYDLPLSSCPSYPSGTTYCTTVENDLGGVTTSFYNALNQVIEDAPPSTSAQATTTYSYDGVGNILSLTNGSGTTNYTYSSDDQVVKASYSGGEATVSYEYNADGDRTQMSDATGPTAYVYNGLEQLQSVMNGFGNVITYGYDPAGNVTCLSYPNSGSTTCQNALSGTGLVEYSYDGLDRMSQMADWVSPGAPVTFTYDNDTNLTGTAFPTTAATSTTHAYDNDDAVTDTSYKSGATTTDLASLIRNVDEQIGSTKPSGGSTETYGYDSINQVTTGTTATGSALNYSYDGNGQLCWTAATTGTSCASPPTGATSYSFNSDGQLCWMATTSGTSCSSPPTGATTYGYNTAGQRLTSTASGGPSTTYGWDQSGDLTCETAPNSSNYSCTSQNASVTSTYGYNGDGLRMSATPAGGSTVQFTWDVLGSVPQLLEDGTSYYLYGPNIGSAPVEQISSSGAPSYLISDTTGVRELVTSGGSLSGSVSYDSYGKRCSCTISTPFGFEGGYTDATSLVYLVNRYYDPTTAQFLSVDPLVNATGQPYAYGEDDPVNETDPSGEYGVCSTILGQGIFGDWLGCNKPPSTGKNSFSACSLAGALKPGSSADEARAAAEQDGFQIPEGYVARPSRSGDGWVFQPPDAKDDENEIRVMDSSADPKYPNGYVRMYNSDGVPVDLEGNPLGTAGVGQPETHLPLSADEGGDFLIGG
jgi:RHS repeat-associated protein